MPELNTTEIMLLRSIKKTAIILLLLVRLERPVNAKEVANMLEIDYSTTRKRLKELSQMGMITRISRCEYIPTQGGRQLVLPAPGAVGNSVDKPVDKPVDNLVGKPDLKVPNAGKPRLASAIKPRFKESVKLREKERELNSLSLSSELNDEEIALVGLLRSMGVYAETALELVTENDEDTIRAHIAYFKHAVKQGIARSPGWLVWSLREKWPAPPGCEQENRRHYVEGYEEWVNF